VALEIIFTHDLKTDFEKSASPVQVSKTLAGIEENTEEEWYVCRSCRQRITRQSDRMEVDGSHNHTFANPSGIVFEVACFSSATGFSFMGPPSTDFSWFSGHSWRITICSACLSHIGWFFSATSSGSFFGLILDKLLLVSLPKEEIG
jgi:hypothetical protein